MVSVYGWATGALLTSPRTLYSMAEAAATCRRSSAACIRASARPYVAILAVRRGLARVLAVRHFASNAVLSAIVRLVTYALVAIAVLRLRQKWPDRAPTFRLPLAPLVVTLAFGFCAYMLWTRPLRQAWMLLVMLAIGTVLFADRTRRLPPRATGG